MAEEKELEKKEREKTMSIVTMTILTGLIGGIFWSAIGYLLYVINLTEIKPNVILEPWAIGNWKESILGTLISIGLIGLISILPALLYYAFFRKYLNIMSGILFGIALFLIVFYVLNPIFPGIKPITEMSRISIITCICIYALYGVFVGYSISYEESEVMYKKEKEAKS